VKFKPVFSFQYYCRLKKTCCLFLKFRWLILFFFLFFSACTTTKNVAYFQDLTDTSKVYTQVINGTYEVQIQPDDILEIIVNSINSEATAPFNMGNANPAITPGALSTATGIPGTRTNPVSTGSTTSGAGYLVSKDGNIDFPVLGTIQVQGLTITQLKDSLKSKLNKYLQDPIVNIRLLNYKITVLGEVAHPSTYSIPSERITVVDAIGMAGDLTIYGKRENVLLIREEKGERKFVRLNLNSSNIFESPYYYLKQNDIIYIEPNQSKIAASDVRQLKYISIATGLITLLIVVATRIK
jgi:polysaccharide export outer membrane protein